MNRRIFLKQTGGAAALAAGLTALERGGVFAQATPVARGDLSGYPELKITVTEQEVKLSTTTIPAGLVLLTVTNNQSASAGSTGAGLIGPPAGMNMDDFLKQATSQLGGTPEAGASPMAGATPDQSSQGGFPAIAYKAVILGGPGNIDPGQSAQAIINVPEGTWAAIAEGNQAPTQVTATAGTPSAEGEPAATVTITEIDFSFSGFDNVPAGPQMWRVDHKGTQPHMLILAQVPAGTTLEQVMTAFNTPENATPAPGGLQPSDFKDRGGVFLQSKGTTVWLPLDLPAGRYLAVCFVPDPDKGGAPHAMEGMTSVFDVGGAAAATPAA